MAEILGTTIAQRYKVLSEIARGNMGVVYKVYDAHVGTELALKVLELGFGATQALWDNIARRFEQEKTIVSSLRNDHVVRPIDYGRLEGDGRSGPPWYTMELLEGETLAGRVRSKGRLDRGEVLNIFKQIRVAMRECHLRDPAIVHRDLKPENIFLKRIPADPSNGYTVKILDFGIAKILDRCKPNAGTLPMGTPEYSAPEQLQLSGTDARISAKTDVWALGLIAFYALTGHSYWLTTERLAREKRTRAEGPGVADAGVGAVDDAPSIDIDVPVSQGEFEALQRSLAAVGPASPQAGEMEADLDLFSLQSDWNSIVPASVRARDYQLADWIIPKGFDEWFIECVCVDQTSRHENADVACGELEKLLGGQLLEYYNLDPDLEGKLPQTKEERPIDIKYCPPSTSAQHLFTTAPASELRVGADRSVSVGENFKLRIGMRPERQRDYLPPGDAVMTIRERSGRTCHIDAVGGRKEDGFVFFDIKNHGRYRADARYSARIIVLILRGSDEIVIVCIT